MVCVFKNWKLLFKKICKNTYGWKNILKYVKYYLKIKNNCLKTQTKHPIVFSFSFSFPAQIISSLFTSPLAWSTCITGKVAPQILKDSRKITKYGHIIYFTINDASYLCVLHFKLVLLLTLKSKCRFDNCDLTRQTKIVFKKKTKIEFSKKKKKKKTEDFFF